MNRKSCKVSVVYMISRFQLNDNCVKIQAVLGLHINSTIDVITHLLSKHVKILKLVSTRLVFMLLVPTYQHVKTCWQFVAS